MFHWAHFNGYEVCGLRGSQLYQAQKKCVAAIANLFQQALFSLLQNVFNVDRMDVIFSVMLLLHSSCHTCDSKSGGCITFVKTCRRHNEQLENPYCSVTSIRGQTPEENGAVITLHSTSVVYSLPAKHRVVAKSSQRGDMWQRGG